jgi:excinuclease UvrABC nuclease subunit
LHAIESLAQRQGADRRAVGTIDVIGLAVDGARAAVQLFPLRDGRLIDRYAFHLENVDGQDTATLLEAFAIEYYGSSPSRAKRRETTSSIAAKSSGPPSRCRTPNFR